MQSLLPGNRSGLISQSRVSSRGRLSPTSRSIRQTKRHGFISVSASALLAFALQQLPLAFYAPAVARQLTVAAHHAMAGNRHRQAVGSTGLGHGAKGFGCADTLGNLRIAGGAAQRN